jgi:hypothetical protein
VGCVERPAGHGSFPGVTVGAEIHGITATVVEEAVATKRQPYLRGFATINHWADDLVAAMRWYSEFLGIEPYFEQPGPDGRLALRRFPPR